MKKILVIGLLVLGVCASSGAKTNTLKPTSHIIDKVDCLSGITECGTSYMICGNNLDTKDGLYVWDTINTADCYEEY